MSIYRKRGLDHSAVGAWKIKQKGIIKKGPCLLVGWIYDGSIGRSKKIIRGMLLKTDNEMAYLMTKDKEEVKVIKNTLKIVC
ncbi:MAG TPA: hypothetical protein PKC87_01325 [Candidatus Absconditabacterales bacterium]|nr:hypothetical protein [Candidatus Absconditabacterales bacterium]